MKQALKLLLILSPFFFSYAVAQESKPTSFFSNKPNPEIVNHFNNVMGQKTRLYNGEHYEFDSPTIEGNAFFGSSLEFVIGTVNYDGFRFEKVPLLYDMFRDIVITKVSDFSTAFTLFTSKVDDFYISNHHFIKIDTLSGRGVLRPGFYDLAYDGEIKVLIKRTKSIQDKVGNIVQKYFSYGSSYYVLKENQYYKISNKSSFMSLFKAQKALFNKKLKENNLNFRKNPEEAIVLLVDYYFNLKN